MNTHLVVFDVDGTLVDSQAHILAAMTQAYAILDMPPPVRAEVLGIVGLSLPVAIARLSPHLGAADLARLVAGYKDAFTALRAASLSPLYPGAGAVLDALSQVSGLALGIATGKSRRGLVHILEAYGWGDRFATVQVADDHPSKPHPSMLQACMRETGVCAERAVMIGDTRFDMDMAQAAGLHAIGVSWGYHPADQLGAYVIDSFAALPAALDRIWTGAAA